MINGFRIYDADAHVNVAPQMWEDLPKEFAVRRPRSALIHDNDELAYFTAGWFTDGRMEPYALGPGLQPAMPPRWVVEGPHGEGRENAPQELLARADVSENQKHNMLFDNPVCLFGEI